MIYVLGRTETRRTSNLTSGNLQLFNFLAVILFFFFLLFVSPVSHKGKKRNHTHCFENSMGARTVAQKLSTMAVLPEF